MVFTAESKGLLNVLVDQTFRDILSRDGTAMTAWGKYIGCEEVSG